MKRRHYTSSLKVSIVNAASPLTPLVGIFLTIYGSVRGKPGTFYSDYSAAAKGTKDRNAVN